MGETKRVWNTSRMLLWLVMAMVLCAGPQAFAQPGMPQLASTPSPSANSPVNLSVVVVKGSLPGPGLWKVSKGDHVMWVLGISAPLPAQMTWKSQEVEKLLSGSQEVLLPPGVVTGARLGFFGQLFLLPSLIGIRNNPDGEKLVDVLPAPVYRRWEIARAKYGLDGGRIERLRPMFAGKALYASAIRQAGLSEDGGAEATVAGIANRFKIKEASTQYVLIIEDPHKAAKVFKTSSIDDIGCLSHVLDMLDSDLMQTKTRANAWATGDLRKLRAMAGTEARDSCLSAVSGASFAQKLGMVDLQQRIDDAWMSAAKKAIGENKQTFALLPMEQVLSGTGYLARLKASGYTVLSPYGESDDSTVELQSH